MKNGLRAAGSAEIEGPKSACVCCICCDGRFLLAHTSGASPTAHLGAGCDRALSTSSTCLTTTFQLPLRSADGAFRETDEH